MSITNEATKEKTLELVAKTQNGNEIPGTTDGIGNKGYYHWMQRTFRNAAIDAMAMNLNDAAVKMFEAKYCQNHIMVPKEDGEAILEIVSVLAEECKKRGIAIISGETAIHSYSDSLEISISLSGGKYLGRKLNRFEKGDYLVGAESSGLMSNSFTEIREIFGGEFRKEFVEPTFIYYDAVINLLKRPDVFIDGMAHITGGAFSKLKKLIDADSDIVIEQNSYLKPHDIFYEAKEKGRLTDGEMYRIFNCGVGFILSVPNVPRGNLEEIIAEFSSNGFRASSIGKVIQGSGKVRIKSSFSDGEVVL